MKKMTFTVTAENVPEDEMERAEMLGRIKPHRDAFVKALDDLGVKITHVTKVITAKGTAAPRKPRAVRAAAE